MEMVTQNNFMEKISIVISKIWLVSISIIDVILLIALSDLLDGIGKIITIVVAIVVSWFVVIKLKGDIEINKLKKQNEEKEMQIRDAKIQAQIREKYEIRP